MTGKNCIFLLNFCRMQVNKTPTESTEQYRKGIKGRRADINKTYPEALLKVLIISKETYYKTDFHLLLWLRFTKNRSVLSRGWI